MRPRILPSPVLLGTLRDANNRPARGGLYQDPVHDAESFIRTAIDEGLRRMGSGMYITDEEYEDLFFELLRVMVKLEQGFDPERNPSFAGYARWVLNRRLVDHGPRTLLGRSGLRTGERLHEELDERAAHGTRPWETQPEEQSDPDGDRRTDGGWFQGDRDRQTAWAHTLLGVRAA